MWALSPSSDSSPRSFVILFDSSCHWVLQRWCHGISDTIHARAWLVTCSGDDLFGTLISLWLDVIVTLVRSSLVSDDVPRWDSDRVHTSAHLVSVRFVTLSQPDFVIHALVLQTLNACEQLLCVYITRGLLSHLLVRLIWDVILIININAVFEQWMQGWTMVTFQRR